MAICPRGMKQSAWALAVILATVTGEASICNADQRIEAPPSANDPLSQPLSLETTSKPAEPGAAARQAAAHERTISTLVGGLAVTVGAFLLLVWATRRTSSTGVGPLPPEVVESLGKLVLNGRQNLQLIRFGSKLVLLGTSPQGAATLAEITDADEAARLAGLCQQSRPKSVTSSFREVLGDFAKETDSTHSSAAPSASDPKYAYFSGTRRSP